MTESLSNRRCVLLLSGGIDSVCLIPILQQSGVEIHPIFCDYGQASRENERAAASFCASALGIKPVEIKTLDCWSRAQYPLLEGSAVGNRLTDYFLPFRNLALATVAAVHAREVDAGFIAFGFNTDCLFDDTSEEFMDSLDAVLRLSVPGSAIRLWRKGCSNSKAGLVKIGLEAGAPLEATYSCYHPTRCFACPSCEAVSRAFSSLEGRCDHHKLAARNPNNQYAPNEHRRATERTLATA